MLVKFSASTFFGRNERFDSLTLRFIACYNCESFDLRFEAFEDFVTYFASSS